MILIHEYFFYDAQVSNSNTLFSKGPISNSGCWFVEVAKVNACLGNGMDIHSRKWVAVSLFCLFLYCFHFFFCLFSLYCSFSYIHFLTFSLFLCLKPVFLFPFSFTDSVVSFAECSPWPCHHFDELLRNTVHFGVNDLEQLEYMLVLTRSFLVSALQISTIIAGFF